MLTQRQSRRKRAQAGQAAAVMLILLTPAILGIFGLGFDMLRWVHARNIAQGRVDFAVESAARTTYINPDIKTEGIQHGSTASSNFWEEIAYTVYHDNTEQNREKGSKNELFTCGWDEIIHTPIMNADQRCGGEVELIGTTAGLATCTANGTEAQVRMTVRETVPMVFLHFFGVEEIPFEYSAERTVESAC